MPRHFTIRTIEKHLIDLFAYFPVSEHPQPVQSEPCNDQDCHKENREIKIAQKYILLEIPNEILITKKRTESHRCRVEKV